VSRTAEGAGDGSFSRFLCCSSVANAEDGVRDCAAGKAGLETLRYGAWNAVKSRNSVRCCNRLRTSRVWRNCFSVHARKPIAAVLQRIAVVKAGVRIEAGSQNTSPEQFNPSDLHAAGRGTLSKQ
jgi:hypothetical protein